MTDLLTSHFFWSALLAGVLSGVSCGLIGVFVVTLRVPFLGVAMSHAAFVGVIFGALLGLPGEACALALALAAAIATGHVAERADLPAGLSLNVIFAFLISMVFLGIGLLGDRQFAFDLMWGNILSVSTRGLLWIALSGAITLGVIAALFGSIKAIIYDRELAASAGIHDSFVYYVLLTVMALTVTANLSAIGGLIIFGLVICPAAAAYQLTYRLSTMCVLAAVFGALSAALGLIIVSYMLNLPSGASIVLMSVVIFAVCTTFSPKRRQKRIGN